MNTQEKDNEFEARYVALLIGYVSYAVEGLAERLGSETLEDGTACPPSMPDKYATLAGRKERARKRKGISIEYVLY